MNNTTSSYVRTIESKDVERLIGQDVSASFHLKIEFISILKVHHLFMQIIKDFLFLLWLITVAHANNFSPDVQYA